VEATVRAELLERRAYECNLTDEREAAVHAAEEAVAVHRALGDRRRMGNALRLLSVVSLGSVPITDAKRLAVEAVTALEGLAPGRDLALAYSNLAQILLNLDDVTAARQWGGLALQLGEPLADHEVLVSALTNIGAAQLVDGDPAGAEKLERAIALAGDGDLAPHIAAERVARAHACAAWAATRTRRYPLADRHIRAGLEHCTERDLHLWRCYLLAYRARSCLDQGLWSDAGDAAAAALRDPAPEQLARIAALVVLGLARARQGQSDADTPLRAAVTLAEASGMVQAIGPAHAAWSEAAWLRGGSSRPTTPDGSVALVDASLRDPWLAGELWCWRSRAGTSAPTLARLAEPYALQQRGDWVGAADAWRAIACPYEASLALADSGDSDALRRSLDELHALGARPAARIVARRLRERGARRLPRGPRPATLEHPAGLTAREHEVLTLLSRGHGTNEVAAALLLSQRTVHHHVAEILHKLGVHNRDDAVRLAGELGLIETR
jgi:DNA-binding CsgD family transcriptional regulator